MEYKLTDQQTWDTSQELTTNEKNDWNLVVNLTHLKPESEYEYRVIFRKQSEQIVGPVVSFHTFPLEKEPVHFQFNFGSCLMR